MTTAGFSLLRRNLAITSALIIGGGALALYHLWWKRRKSFIRNQLDLREFIDGLVESSCCSDVVVVESTDEWKGVTPTLKQDLKSYKVIGVDCEWVTEGRCRKRVSMLQLSSLHCTILIRLHKLNFMPHSLCQLMQDRSVIKIGVGVFDDAAKLQCDYQLDMRGCVDLRHIAARHKKAWVGAGLKTLAECIVGINLDKSDHLRQGDWEAEQLSPAQIKYASQDSQAGLAIGLKLVGLKFFNLSQQIHYENEAYMIIQERTYSLCQGITDVNCKPSSMKRSATADSSLQAPKKISTKSISASALRQGVMYSNCEMQAPDGQVLCVCDRRKAEWYIDKGLATMTSNPGDEKMVICLKFEPRGRPSGDRDYYRSQKDNVCVVCGTDNSFVRKNIVPREYRKHFPEILKSHSSHDVVLLCAMCHRRTASYDQAFKEHLAKLCDAPYTTGLVKVDQDMKKVKSAARALNSYKVKLPEKKLSEYTKVLCQFYGTSTLTDDMLQMACDVDERTPVDDSPTHGSLVVKYMMSNGKLQEFEKMWRERFVAAMEPRPDTKAVEHGLKVMKFYMENSSVQDFQKMWRQRFVDLMEPKYLGEFWHIDYDHMDYKWVKPEDTSNNPDS